MKLGEQKPLVSLNGIPISLPWIVYGLRNMGNVAEAGEHKHDIVYSMHLVGYNTKHQPFAAAVVEFFILAIVKGLQF